MRVVPLSELLPGMIAAQDILSNDNRFILRKGTPLTGLLINRLAIHGVLSVVVDERPVPPPEMANNHVRTSAEFREFQKAYIIEAEALKDKLNAVIAKNEPLDVDGLINSAVNIVTHSQGRLSLFDMLHNMYEFDDSTYSHCLNVAIICYLFAGWMRMNEEETRIATACGLLHDLGKLLVDQNIIQKPATLTSEEFGEIKKHPQAGYQLLKELDADETICKVALMHHERCDGSGYPSALTEPQIDNYAKLVAIADVYDAMTSNRVYRGPMCPFHVIASFEENGYQKYGTYFLLPFLENIANTYLTSPCHLSDGRTGTIVFINKQKLSRPTIKCGDEYVSLFERPDLTIEYML